MEKFQTYEFQDVNIDNLLDLTDLTVRKKLGVREEQLVRARDIDGDTPDQGFNYEITNVLGTWARARYDGVIVPGARGSQNYENVVLFKQSKVDQVLGRVVPDPLPKQV